MDNGTMVLLVKKDKEWISFSLPDGKKLRVLVRNPKSGQSNKSFSRVIVQCPKSIKIEREENQNPGIL